jgi:cytochrome c biogenesis protein CcmG/thiol:disulfide interchange protein DsbE
MRRKKFPLSILLPIIMVAALIALVMFELRSPQNPFFSTALKEPLPEFQLPDMWTPNATLTAKDLHGKVALLNIWASWCPSCREELPVLLDIQKNDHIPIYSIVYKDNPQDAKLLLMQHGNPFVASGVDQNGNAAKILRVYGTPETFLIDKHGMIRYRQVGVIDANIWQKVLLPLVNQYNLEN